MSHAAFGERLPDVSARRVGLVALILNVQLVCVVAYYAFSSATLVDPRYPLYGLVWLNVGGYAIYRTQPPRGVGFRTRRRALAVGAAYFGLLAVFGGLVSAGLGEMATGFRVAWLPPGWGPAVIYAGASVVVAMPPAFLVGYLALAYLVYVTVLEASGSAVAGVVGLFSCVSCTWPVVAAVASSVVGGAGLLGATVLDLGGPGSYYYDLSTLVFVVTVLLLSWRPGFR